MAFPTVAGFGGNNSGGNGTSTVIDLATIAGAPSDGDLYLIFITKDGSAAFTGMTPPSGSSGWSVQGNSSTSNALLLGYGTWRTGNGTSVTFTHASEGTAWHVYRISGWKGGTLSAGFYTAFDQGDSTNPNPPNNTIDGVTRDHLFIAVAANDGNTAITAGPTNYTDFQNDRWANANGVGIASARRNLNGASDDPDTFTMTTEQWCSATVAILPSIQGATIASTATLSVPTVRPSQLVTGAHRASTVSANAPNDILNRSASPSVVLAGFGGSNSGANVTTTTVDLETLAGVASTGDLLLVMLAVDGSSAPTWPSGWQTIGGNIGINSPSVATVEARFRVVCDGDPTSIAITHASQGSSWQVFRIAAGTYTVPNNASFAEALDANSSTSFGSSSVTFNTHQGQLYDVEHALAFALVGIDGNATVSNLSFWSDSRTDKWANADGVVVFTARAFLYQDNVVIQGGKISFSSGNGYGASIFRVLPANAASYTGPQGVYTQTPLASTVTLYAPSAGIGGQAVTSGNVSSSVALTAPTITVGAVTVTGTTIAAGSSVSPPRIVTLVTSGTVSSTTTLTAPSTSYQVSSASITSGSSLTSPSLRSVVAGATISSAASLTAPSAASIVATATIASTLSLFLPTAQPGAVTVTGANIASTVTITQPTVVPGAVTVIGATLSSTATINAPSTSHVIAGAHLASTAVTSVPAAVYQVSTPTITSTAQLFGHAVGTKVSAAFLDSTASLSVPTLAYRLIAASLAATLTLFSPTVQSTSFVVGSHLSSTAALNPSTASYVVSGATLSPGSILFGPTTSYQISTAHRSSTAILSVPALAYRVAAPTITTQATLNEPVISQDSASNITGAHRASTITLTAPSTSYQVSAPTLSSSTAINQPSTSYQVQAANRSSTATTTAPSIAVGAVTVTGVHLSSTTSVTAPRLDYSVLTSTLVSGASLSAPTLNYIAATVHLSSTLSIFSPSVTGDGDVLSAFLPSTATLLGPHVHRTSRRRIRLRASLAGVSVSATSPLPYNLDAGLDDHNYDADQEEG